MTCVSYLRLVVVVDNLTLKTSSLLRTDSGLSSSLWIRSSPVMSSYINPQFTFYCNQMVPKTAVLFSSFLLVSKTLSFVTFPLCSFFSQERLKAKVRGASKIKLKNVNKKRMDTARRIIFFGISQGIHC